MGDNILYFPYIEVPQSSWFTRVLLYWDEVGSIVPSEYQRQRARLGSYMQELVETGLVKEVVPAEYHSAVPEFRSAFLELIDRSSYLEKRRGIALRRHETIRIHIEKMIGNGLTADLVERGLARPVRYPWWEVETITANLFMGYLASVLGKLDELRMCPITDNIDALSVFSRTPQRILSRRSLAEQLRMNVIADILPSPERVVPIKELLNFKRRHSSLLTNFRRQIEAFLIDLSAIPQVEQRDERVQMFKDQANQQIDEIISRMSERQWPRIVLGEVCSIVAAAIPGISAVATGNASIALAALPGLISATYLAFRGAPERQREILRDPLAYAAYARRRFSTRK